MNDQAEEGEANTKTSGRFIALITILTFGIFILDLNIPLGFAGGVPYVVLVLLSLFSPQIGLTSLMAAIGSLLTVAGYFLSPPGGIGWVVLLNRGLALAVIWTTAMLVHRYRSAIETTRISETSLREKEIDSEFSKLHIKHQRIVQIEKLSALGLMIGEIAHQINNPLVGVVNMAQLALREQGQSKNTKELLVDIQSAGEDCRAFLHQMMEFSKISCFDRKPTEMQHLIEETITLCRQSAKYPISILADCPQRPVLLEVDRILIRHALFNLISNAIQADQRGEITVGLFPHLRTEDQAGGWNLVVSDKGPGILESDMDKIFTPFFTTRTSGTGLGLSLVQHVSILHGGEVWAENRPEGGAKFTLWLPEHRDSS